MDHFFESSKLENLSIYKSILQTFLTTSVKVCVKSLQMTSWKMQTQEKHQKAKDHHMRESKSWSVHKHSHNPPVWCLTRSVLNLSMLASYWLICSYVVDLWPQQHPYWPTERSALHMCEHTAFTQAISQQALFKTVNKSLQFLQVFCNFQTIKHRNYGTELSMCKQGWHRMFGSNSQSNSLPFKGNGMPQ